MPDRKEPLLDMDVSKPVSRPTETRSTESRIAPGISEHKAASPTADHTSAIPPRSTQVATDKPLQKDVAVGDAAEKRAAAAARLKAAVEAAAKRSGQSQGREPVTTSIPRSTSTAPRPASSGFAAATSNPEESASAPTGQGGGGGLNHPRYPMHHEPDQPGGGGGFSPLVWVALVLAVIGLAFGGWQYMRAEKQQQSMLALADRVQELEIRLSETGQDLSEAGTTFREKLEWADSEIRKLWVVAHQRNRPAIAELQEQVTGLEGKLTQAERQASEAATAARTASERATEAGRNLQTQTEALKKDITAMEQRLTEVSLTTSTLDQRLRNQDSRNEVTALKSQLEALEQKVAAGGMPPELQQKLNEQEEILASLEASRSQLVSRVTQLMDQVRELQQAR